MILRLALAVALLAAPLAATEQKVAVPVDAVAGVLDLFKDYRIVGLGEGPHNNIEGHRFRLSLIRDRRFPTVVNDIVVEPHAYTARL